MNKIIIYVVLGVVLLGGLFYFVMPKAEPAQNNAQQSVKSFDLVVKENKLVSGPAVMTVSQGDKVKITVTADAHDDLHLHGYDLEVEVMKDGWASLDFTAITAGSFPLELHNADMEIATLVVNPR